VSSPTLLIPCHPAKAENPQADYLERKRKTSKENTFKKFALVRSDYSFVINHLDS